jgi:hypothetical protein
MHIPCPATAIRLSARAQTVRLSAAKSEGSRSSSPTNKARLLIGQTPRAVREPPREHRHRGAPLETTSATAREIGDRRIAELGNRAEPEAILARLTNGGAVTTRAPRQRGRGRGRRHGRSPAARPWTCAATGPQRVAAEIRRLHVAPVGALFTIHYIAFDCRPRFEPPQGLSEVAGAPGQQPTPGAFLFGSSHWRRGIFAGAGERASNAGG